MTQVAGLLTGKAIATFAALTPEDVVVYEKVMEVILRRYETSDSGRIARWVRSCIRSMQIILEFTL